MSNQPRQKFTFSHAAVMPDGRKRLYWEFKLPTDSRSEQVSCDAGWYWGHITAEEYGANVSEGSL